MAAQRTTGLYWRLMGDGERQFVRWLAERCRARDGRVLLGIGDDMGILAVGPHDLLVTADMLLDGVHFDTERHDLTAIGHKAAACSLSDCAAMAVRPVAAVVSLALPRDFHVERAKQLIDALATTCEAFGCDLIGGDTNSWTHPLVVDVAMLARKWPGIEPVRRSGARAGDGIFVTGPLGGSLLVRHLTFTPRVHEAKQIAATLQERLHAMIDISDGVAIDLDRIAEASGVGAMLDETELLHVASTDAHRAAADGCSVLEHVLADGEDFELLLTAEVGAAEAAALGLHHVGTVESARGLRLRRINGTVEPLEPKGYQHL